MVGVRSVLGRGRVNGSFVSGVIGQPRNRGPTSQVNDGLDLKIGEGFQFVVREVTGK